MYLPYVQNILRLHRSIAIPYDSILCFNCMLLYKRMLSIEIIVSNFEGAKNMDPFPEVLRKKTHFVKGRYYRRAVFPIVSRISSSVNLVIRRGRGLSRFVKFNRGKITRNAQNSHIWGGGGSRKSGR